jgi:flagellar hook-length control protein FliK
MRISQQQNSRGQSTSGSKPPAEAWSFDRVLRFKAERSERAPRKNSAKDEAELVTAPVWPGMTAIGAPSQDSAQARADLSASARGIEIEKLAVEIVQEISSTKSADGCQRVDIHFDSKILGGLVVRISEQDNSLSIAFLAQSERVATLLSEALPELAERLKHAGIAIDHIGIRKTPKGTNRSSTGNGQRRWERTTY